MKKSSSLLIALLLVITLPAMMSNSVKAPEVKYYLNVNIVGSGSVLTNGTSPYDPGDVVMVGVAPAVGWEFDSWSGDLSGSLIPEFLVMNSNKSVTATFTRLSERDVEAVSQTVTNNTVMPGDVVDIYVVVTNNGNGTLETFNLTCYYDGTEIGTQRVEDLAIGEHRTVIFFWNTSGVSLNGYLITAWADSAAEITEVDESNNWCTMPLSVFVVPEIPLGTILAFLSMFIALIGYAGFRRFRTK